MPASTLLQRQASAQRTRARARLCWDNPFLGSSRSRPPSPHPFRSRRRHSLPVAAGAHRVPAGRSRRARHPGRRHTAADAQRLRGACGCCCLGVNACCVVPNGCEVRTLTSTVEPPYAPSFAGRQLRLILHAPSHALLHQAKPPFGFAQTRRCAPLRCGPTAAASRVSSVRLRPGERTVLLGVGCLPCLVRTAVACVICATEAG